MSSQKNEGSLANLRVLDMAQGGCTICGKIFADLGADVIKIEPPGGDLSRRIGPFYKDIPDPQKSLFWFAYNTSKRSITLDIETSDGQQIFKRLAKTTDIVVESFPPGYLDNLGIGYQLLSQLNPGIIVTSITPFGQTGPKAHYKGCDLMAWASSDGLITTGWPDRPPAGLHGAFTDHIAPFFNVVTLIAALDYRRKTGKGQYIDQSQHEAVIQWIASLILDWTVNQREPSINCNRLDYVAPHNIRKEGEVL
jgi:crotonobetainyl-CoA:carnitine CoA-transferase CaiB-like acyl-CoA transferase